MQIELRAFFKNHFKTQFLLFDCFCQQSICIIISNTFRVVNSYTFPGIVVFIIDNFVFSNAINYLRFHNLNNNTIQSHLTCKIAYCRFLILILFFCITRRILNSLTRKKKSCRLIP